MSRTKKLKGYWWLPSNPAREWFGSVSWRSSESPEVKLHYRTVDEQTSSPPIEAESILGVDEGGAPISLLRLGSSGGSRSGFLSDRKYTAGHLLRGVHVTSRDGFRVHRVNVCLQYLGTWLREEGFEATTLDGSGFNPRYQRPDDRSFEIAKGVTVYLSHYARSSTRNRERKVTYDIVFAVEKKHSFTWKQASRHIEALKDLLHFACLRPVKSTGITFENLDHTSDFGDTRHPKKIELLNAGVASPQKENLHETDFVFMFEDVKSRFDKLCADWFQFCIEQREALGCYHSTVYFSLPDGLRLISITQALEAYHERRYRPKGDTKFKDRIKELCYAQRTRAEQVVGDIEEFATAVTDSRDYYTHHHPSIRAKGNVAAGLKLTLMPYHLQFLFRLSVLNQFGLGADKFNMLRRRIPDRIVEY